jgi:oligopeptide/dipeptide ABC transporter ATP-binding protein
LTVTHNEYDRGSRPVLSVYNLRKRFGLERGFFAPLGRYVHAVNGVSFSIDRNEAYGLVGEAGCGKTATARLLIRMYEADEGEILFRGFDKVIQDYVQDVRQLKGKDFRRYRERVKYVFQDPARSLNPRMTIYEALTSAFRWSTEKRDQASLREEAASILEEMGISAADLERRPAEFPRGQRQMISIARGLMMKPDLLICDEVVSALDVSNQVQILNLLLDLRKRRKSSGEEISFLFIAGDLKTASYFCDRIGVMYQGEIMEEAPAVNLWKSHLHPYTELLFSSAENAAGKEAPPSGHPQAETKKADPELLRLTGGCAFASRCPYAEDACYKENPPLAEAEDDHFVRCWR